MDNITKKRCCIPAHEPVKHSTSRMEALGALISTPLGERPDFLQAISFPACRSYVGTDTPVIMHDGEGPVRRVRLSAFRIEAYAVTNLRFRKFVTATGYQTDAEKLGWSFVFAGLLPKGTGNRSEEMPWWVRRKGAYWNSPEGENSHIEERLDHPAVHISWNDARACAAWYGGRLPSEAEWEHAAKSGATVRRYPWGEDEPTDDQIFCNIWQGSFPNHNTTKDGYYGTAPVHAFKPNDSGIFNCSGNVWEWCEDLWHHYSISKTAKKNNALARDHNERILKGGSFLCHKSYCYRYRIAARSGRPHDTGASHTGFRIAYDELTTFS